MYSCIYTEGALRLWEPNSFIMLLVQIKDNNMKNCFIVYANATMNIEVVFKFYFVKNLFNNLETQVDFIIMSL